MINFLDELSWRMHEAISKQTLKIETSTHLDFVFVRNSNFLIVLL